MSPRRARTPFVATTDTSAPVGLPRLLAPPVADHPAHLARYGPLPVGGRRGQRGDLIAAVERSGLRGRGGGGFPTGRKLRAVASGGRGPIVVANGAEGEPASSKDSVLMQRAPHLVIDGAAAASHAVGADAIHFVVDRGDVGARDAMNRAILERTHEMPRPGSWRVVELPSRYVAGEESAVVNFLNGREAKPVSVPPRPYERGVRGRPTLVQNVETLANLGLIARYGPDWFGSVGTTDEPGSLLATVSGAVVRPAIYEFAFGTRFETVLDAAGGVSEPVQALLVGGYFGAWLRPEQTAGLALAHGVLRNAGAALGCGVVSVLPVAACGVTETARVARYLAAESAGQCGPCVHGLPAIAAALAALAAGSAARGTVRTVERWLDDVAGRGACHLPDAAVGFVRSSLVAFADDFATHERTGPCEHARRAPVLPLPSPATSERGFR